MESYISSDSISNKKFSAINTSSITQGEIDKKNVNYELKKTSKLGIWSSSSDYIISNRSFFIKKQEIEI